MTPRSSTLYDVVQHFLFLSVSVCPGLDVKSLVMGFVDLPLAH